MNPKPISSKTAGTSESPLPTVNELAQIAALLAGESLPKDASKLAQSALQLWEACNQELLNRRVFLGLLDHDFEIHMTGIAGVRGESPKSWPCSFEEALRLVMPKKRTKADRYVQFRSFLRAIIHSSRPAERQSTKDTSEQIEELNEKMILDETATAFNAFKQQGFKNQKEYAHWLAPFSAWLTAQEAEKVSTQRSNAAKVRWAKKK